MELTISILFFIIGCFIGSFLNLAIYRIPLKKDIVHERSFCPNCNHKLGFFDLIPIISYIILGGRCRYCKEKIGKRYLFLELFSGIIIVLFYISINLSFKILEINKIIYLISFIFIYITIALISGIDFNNRTINRSVLIFGVITQFIYILYFCFVNNVAIYMYSICLGLLILVLLFEKMLQKKIDKSNYFIELICFSLYINMIVEPVLFLLIILLTILMALWDKSIKIIKKNANLQSIDEIDEGKTKIPIGFFMGVSTLIIIIIENFTYYWNF